MAAPTAGPSPHKPRFEVLDGKRVRELAKDEAAFTAYLESAFEHLDADASGLLDQAELRPAFLRVAKLLGLPPPGTAEQLDELVQKMFKIEGETVRRGVSKAEFVSVSKQVLSDVAAMLDEDPLFVSVFNGVVLKELAAKPEALAAVISKAFAQLDKDGSGKLSRGELLPVLRLLAGEGGLPPKDVVERLEAETLAHFGSGPSDELDQSQFVELFKELVLFMADKLEAEPVMVAEPTMTVLNGHRIRKLLADNAQFTKEADTLFQQWDRSKAGKLSKADIGDGLKRIGMAIGLPPGDAKEVEKVYQELFAAADFDDSGFVDRGEFDLLLRALLESLAAQLEAHPIVVEVNVASSVVEGGKIHDGHELFEALADEAKIDALLSARFDDLDGNKNGTLSKAELKPALLMLASLLGLPPPGTADAMDKMLDELFLATVGEDFSEEVDRARFVSTTKDILKGLAADLEKEPVVAVDLDGSRLKTLLENEAEFTALTQKLFDSLDTDGNGHLSMAELKPALHQLGVALGMPPAGATEEADAIVAAAVEEYGGEKKELTHEEFGKLLRDILSDIARRLSSNPVIVAQSVKVLNGSRLRKLLADDEEFTALVEELFVDWDTSKTGRLSKVDLIAGLKKLGMAFGLPPPKAREADRVYNSLFVTADMDDSGFIDRKELADLLRLLFVSIAGELEKNPIVVEATVVSY